MTGSGSLISTLSTDVRLLIERNGDMEKKLDDLYKVVVVGNGKPSLRQQVARHDDWINNANNFIWIVITALVGQLIASTCAMSVIIVGVLWQIGVLHP